MIRFRNSVHPVSFRLGTCPPVRFKFGISQRLKHTHTHSHMWTLCELLSQTWGGWIKISKINLFWYQIQLSKAEPVRESSQGWQRLSWCVGQCPPSSYHDLPAGPYSTISSSIVPFTRACRRRTQRPVRDLLYCGLSFYELELLITDKSGIWRCESQSLVIFQRSCLV